MRVVVVASLLVILVAPARGEDVVVKAEPCFAGEACVEIAAKKLGKKLTQRDVFDASGVDPVAGRGCEPSELARALSKLGFTSPEALLSREAIAADLAKGVPSIVFAEGERHYRLVTAFDAAKDTVVVLDPASGEKKELAGAELMKTLSGRLRLEPGAIVEPAAHEGFTRAAYAQHVIGLKDKAKGFTIVIEPPFVVISDDTPRALARHAEDTVRWAVTKLKETYFKKDPAEILEVWLFKDKASYDKNTKAIFDDTPDTPFGYFSPSHGALIMNVGTGGGTLVHEIVHAFVHPNFPDCPTWFNEGLASLYEQSEERDGKIRGRTNWRLAGIQKAIRDGKVPSFEKLTGTTNRAFYEEDRGTNYGQARYLCYYLQEKGLLVKFWEAFLAAQKEDPTGYQTLVSVLGEDDMAAWQKTWEEYVLGLRFP
jgi:hypothetical protein